MAFNNSLFIILLIATSIIVGLSNPLKAKTINTPHFSCHVPDNWKQIHGDNITKLSHSISYPQDNQVIAFSPSGHLSDESYLLLNDVEVPNLDQLQFKSVYLQQKQYLISQGIDGDFVADSLNKRFYVTSTNENMATGIVLGEKSILYIFYNTAAPNAHHLETFREVLQKVSYTSSKANSDNKNHIGLIMIFALSSALIATVLIFILKVRKQRQVQNKL